ncbi:MAG: SRPBCC family protein, partial [Actinomycetota bacterium]
PGAVDRVPAMPRLPRPPRPAPSVIETSVEIDAPVERVFRFHLDTRNAPLVSPPDSRIVKVDGTFPVTEGCEVRLVMRQKPLPRPIAWVLRVEAVIPNKALVDVAVRSPFPSWRHEHRFEALGRNRTRLTDRVTYTLPGGPLGPVVDRLLVRRMLRKAFAQRHANTKALLERR